MLLLHGKIQIEITQTVPVGHTHTHTHTHTRTHTHTHTIVHSKTSEGRTTNIHIYNTAKQDNVKQSKTRHRKATAPLIRGGTRDSIEGGAHYHHTRH